MKLSPRRSVEIFLRKKGFPKPISLRRRRRYRWTQVQASHSSATVAGSIVLAPRIDARERSASHTTIPFWNGRRGFLDTMDDDRRLAYVSRAGRFPLEPDVVRGTTRV